MRRFPALSLLALGFAVFLATSNYAATDADRARCRELGSKMDALYQARKYAEAARVGEELAAAARTAYGPETLAYGRCLFGLASAYAEINEYAKAEPLYLQAISIYKNIKGEDHPEFARFLDTLAVLYQEMGEYARAEPLYLQALRISERTLGSKHPDYAAGLNGLGMLYLEKGEYTKAEPLLKQALVITEQARGTNHRDYVRSLSNLGLLYWQMGEYPQALPLYLQAAAIAKKVLGETHSEYGKILNNLALLCGDMGYADAEPLLLEALSITRQARGENHPEYAVRLNNLGRFYAKLRKYARAESFLLQAIAIQKKTLGPAHPELAKSLQNLASLYKHRGDDAKVEPLYLQVVAIQKKSLGTDHPALATTLHNLAALYAARGEYAKAEPLFLEAISIHKRTRGENRPDYGASLYGLALLYEQQGRSELALTHLDRGLAALHGNTTRLLSGLSEGTQAEVIRPRWRAVETLLDFARQHATLGDTALRSAEWLARWKALGAEVQTERLRMLRQSNDPQLQTLFTQLGAARQELAQWTLSPPARLQAEAVQHRREAAETKVERLESALAEQSSQFAELRHTGRATMAEIAAATPADSVLLDYARFREFDFKAQKPDQQLAQRRYLVLVTAAGKTPAPVLVDLGLAAPVDRAIDDFRKALTRLEQRRQPEDDKDIREQLLAVRKLVIDPVLPHIQGHKHWIICPDGQLSLVPFEALPLENGKYLVETRKVSYLGAGREAVVYAGSSPETGKRGPPVLVGDPDFDLTPDAQQAELARLQSSESAVALRGVGGARDLRQVLFRPLPATAQEVETAARLIGGRTYLRRQALEGVVKRVSRPEVLYLATHGFFLPDLQSDAGAGDADVLSATTFAVRGVGGTRDEPVPAGPRTRIENPLLRCGLALAGANRRETAPGRDDVDDGILTGMEVAGLDLWGTKLVVLSACQTGLGDVQVGEGVMGLRRVFFVAGARRVLSTLWMVPDKQTQELMTGFITRWKAGRSGVDALREAQIAMIDKLRKEQGHAHPFYWAAFTMTGDWR